MKSQNVVCVNVCVQSHFSRVQLCDTMDCSPPRLCPWDSPDKNLELGCYFLLQEIFQPRIQTHICLLHWQADSSLLSHQESPCSSLHTLKISFTKEKTHSTSFPVALVCLPIMQRLDSRKTTFTSYCIEDLNVL